MVKTTKGPVAPKKPIEAAEDSPAEGSTEMERLADLDDETWERIESMARSQATTPAEVVRRAIVQQFGAPQTSTAYHSK